MTSKGSKPKVQQASNSDTTALTGDAGAKPDRIAAVIQKKWIIGDLIVGVDTLKGISGVTPISAPLNAACELVKIVLQRIQTAYATEQKYLALQENLKDQLSILGRHLVSTPQGEELGVKSEDLRDIFEPLEKYTMALKELLGHLPPFSVDEVIRKRDRVTGFLKRVATANRDAELVAEYTRKIEDSFKRFKLQMNLFVHIGVGQIKQDTTKIVGYSEQILERMEGLTPLITPIPLKPIPIISSSYVERPEMQDFMTKYLLSDSMNKRRCLVLYGLGGSGKTQLVSFWIQKNAKRFWRIFYIDASSQSQLEEDLKIAAQSIDPNYKVETWKQARDYIASEERLSIMIFDGADVASLPLAQYFPNSDHSHTIITTRNSECITYAPDAHIEVSGLTKDQAVALLHAAAHRISSTDKVSLDIVQEMGFHPLAITQAGAYILKYGRFDTYLSTFRKHRAKLMRDPLLHKSSDYNWSVYASIELSYNLLPAKTQMFAKICSFLHNSLIPREIFERKGGRGFDHLYYRSKVPLPEDFKTVVAELQEIFGTEWDEYEFGELISPLLQCSLMDSTSDANGAMFYTFHQLVQAYVRDSITKEERYHFHKATTRIVSSTVPLGDAEEDILWGRQLLPHINSVCNEPTQLMPVDGKAFSKAYQDIGSWTQAEGLLRSCLEQLSESLGPKHRETLDAMCSLGIVLKDRGVLDEAETMMREVLEVQMDSLGKRHPDTIRAMSNLAMILSDRGHLDEAEKMKRDVLGLRMEILGKRHPDTIWAMNNLAIALSDRGHLDEAEKMGREVLELRMDILGKRHPDTITGMNNLAITLSYRGHLDEAERMRRKVLELRMEILGKRHPMSIDSMSNLANTLSDRGCQDEAEKMRREVLDLRMQVLGKRHLDTISAMNNLANTLSDRGHLEEAEKMEREVLELRMEILGKRHPDTITAMNNLAITLGDRGHLDEADKMKREVLELQMETLGKRHPHTIISMNNLAITLSNRGYLDEAEKMGREVLKLRMEILGKRHPDTITGMNNLAITLSELGHLDETEMMRREVLELRMEILGKRHPDTIISMNNLAITLSDRGHLDEAETMRREALELRMEILGKRHSDTIGSMTNLASTLCDRGYLDEAEKMLREVLELRMEIFGRRHPETIVGMNNLAITLSELGQLDEAEMMQREALDLQMGTVGERHPMTNLALSNLSFILYRRGKLEESENMGKKSMAILQEVLGIRHLITIYSMRNLGIVLASRGQSKEAEIMARQVLELQREINPTNLQCISERMHTLAVILRIQGQLQEAEQLQAEALDLSKKIFGLQHMSTIQGMITLALIYISQKAFTAAHPLAEKAATLSNGYLGATHPLTLTCQKICAGAKSQFAAQELEITFMPWLFTC